MERTYNEWTGLSNPQNATTLGAFNPNATIRLVGIGDIKMTQEQYDNFALRLEDFVVNTMIECGVSPTEIHF